MRHHSHSHTDDEIHVMSDEDDSSLRRTFSYTEQATEAVTKLFTFQYYSNPFHDRFRVLSFAAFVAYLLLGLGYYMGHQGFDFVDSLYFSVTTILSIGYGDLEPGSTPERIFTSFYVLLGLVILSAVISAVSDKIHKNYNEQADERVKRAASRMLNVEAQNEQRQNVMEFLDVEEDSTRSSFGKHLSEKLGLSQDTKKEAVVEKKMIEAMQKLNMDMFDEDLRDVKISAIRNFVLLWLIIFFGCLLMLAIEEWNFGDSFYWAIVTITTVGYGDIVPTTDKGKLFTIFYCLVGVAVVARVMNDLITYPLVKKAKQSELKVMMQFGAELSEDTLQHILKDNFFERIPQLRQNEDSISKSEFVLLVLGMMNKLYDKDVIIVSKIFDMLDNNNEGVLSSESIRRQIANARLQEERDSQINEVLSSNMPNKSLKLTPLSHSLKEKVSNIKGGMSKKKAGAYEKVGSESMVNPLIIDDDDEISGDGVSEHSSRRGTYNLKNEIEGMMSGEENSPDTDNPSY